MELDHPLLVQLIRATVQLGQELGDIDLRDLKELEIGKLQIGMLEADGYNYIIIQDTLDNEAFTKRILELIIDEFHQQITDIELDTDMSYKADLTAELETFIKTMSFPEEILPRVRRIIQGFLISLRSTCDTLMLTDLDDGIVETFENSKKDGIITILLEILSEIYFEKSWVGEIPLSLDIESTRNEIWFIYRLGLTDFCLLGRAYYHSKEDRGLLISKIEELVDELNQIIII